MCIRDRSNAAPVFAAATETTYEAEGICKDIKVITGSDNPSDDNDGKADCGAQVYLEILSQLDGAKFSTVTLDNDMKALNKEGKKVNILEVIADYACLLYTSPLIAPITASILASSFPENLSVATEREITIPPAPCLLYTSRCV